MTASPAIATETAADWADEMAILIVAECLVRQPGDARQFVRGRLLEIERNASVNGIMRGTQHATETMSAILGLMKV